MYGFTYTKFYKEIILGIVELQSMNLLSVWCICLLDSNSLASILISNEFGFQNVC